MKKLLVIFVLLLSQTQAFAGGGKGPIEIIIAPSDTFVCVSKNTKTRRHFVRKSSTRSFAKSAALDTCINNTNRARQCTDANCAKESGNLKRVYVENKRSGRMFSAVAYTRLEAKAVALNRCLRNARRPGLCIVQ